MSAAALSLAMASAPAWGQAETQPISPDTSQSATPADKDTSTSTAAPATGPSSDEIVVTGRRAALQAADERKRRSETIIDSVVADDAGKLPDNSITEVLQRVSGVSIVRFAALGDPDHFSVEGSGVQIRGLTGVASRLNGREIFSANNGRAILWGDVTPELMAAVDVYKASTADLIEGGTGGQIDLRTKLPFDFKGGFHAAATGEVSRGDLAQKKDPSASVLLTDRESTPFGDIGVLADFAYSRFSSDDAFFRTEPYFKTNISGKDYYIPGGYDYGEEDFQRRRTGIYVAAQWAPSDSLTFTGTFFQSRYKNQSSDWGNFVTSQQFAVDPTTSKFDSENGLISTDGLYVRDTGTFAPTGVGVTSDGNKGVVRSNTVTRDYALSFKWAPSDSPLAISGAVQRVSSSSIANRLDVFRDVHYFPTSFGYDLSGSLPKVTLPDSAQETFDDPANYFWAASMPHNENNHGVLKAVNLDAEYRFDSDFLRSIKVGGRYSDRTERDLNNNYNWAALGRGWDATDPQLTFANAAAGDVEIHNFDHFFHGQATLPGNLYFPSFDLVSKMNRPQLTALPPTGFCGDPFGPLWNDCSAAGPLPVTGYGGILGIRQPGFVLPDDQTDDLTRTWAGYALVRFGADSPTGISGNVGVRVVHLRNASTGYFQQTGSQPFIRNGATQELGTLANVVTAGAKFTSVLPSINLDFAPTSKTKIRFGYNITMDNATFTALSAAGTLGVATTTNPAQVPGGDNLPGIFTNFTTTSGNPQLKPAMSNNLDLSFEYYASAGTVFHVAPFYKHITNLPIYNIVEQPVTVTFADGSTEATTATSSNYANATKAATVKGVEVGGRAFLDMLPGFLKGFGAEANYTYIDSKNPGDRYLDINGVSHNDVPLVGLSRHNYNLTLLYEKNPLSVRVAYSWRSKYLQSTNANGTNPTYNYYSAAGASPQAIQIDLPVYGDSYGTLDAGIRVKVFEQLSLSLQGTNLTNATQKTLMGGYVDGKMYRRSWFQSDRRVAVGANLAF